MVGAPCKIELILPPDCDPGTFLAQLDEYLKGIPHIVPGFNASLGVTRHVTNNHDVITASQDNLGTRHDRLLDLVETHTRNHSPLYAFSKYVEFNALGTSLAPFLLLRSSLRAFTRRTSHRNLRNHSTRTTPTRINTLASYKSAQYDEWKS